MFQKLFGSKKEKEETSGHLFAIQSGTIVSLEEVPDPVFSQKMLGDGVAIIPEIGRFYSPADGVVDNVMDTGHALAILTEDGAQILIHVGLETVELKGAGFTPRVTAGQKVKAGDLILEADLELLKSRGYQVITMVLILNSSSFSAITSFPGSAKEKETVMLKYS